MNLLWLESLWQDARSGVRGLLRSPGTTAAALLALALGIGANTAVFSVARATLGRDLPYRDPDRLVAAFQGLPGLDHDSSPATLRIFQEWRRQRRSFEDLAALSYDRMNLTSPGRPTLVPQAWVTANFFEVAGAELAAGRGFREEDFRQRARVAVLSHRLFQERFGGEPSRLEQGIVLDGLRYSVIGVAPPGFSLFGNYEVWLPDVFRPPLGDAGWHFLWVYGRLRPGASLEQADRELEAVSRTLAVSQPEIYADRTVKVEPLRAVGLEDVRRTLAVLGLFVAFVLLIACADVAGLLLARATGREGEVALRAALGADRGRLLRWMLAESVILFLAGGLLALPLAIWGTRLLARIGPERLAKIAAPETGPHLGVLLFTFGLSLATGMLCGLLPALTVTGRLAQALKDARRLAGRPARRLLIAGQVALTTVLVVGAGLLLQSFGRLLGVDPGFRPDGILALRLQPPVDRYSEPAARAALYRQVLARASKISGAEAAVLQDSLPFLGNASIQFTVEGVPNPPPGKNPVVSVRCVTPGYFEMMGILRKSGRFFRDSDGIGTEPVVIINETMAERYWPGKSPLGKRFGFGYPDTYEWMTVVGVVRDTRQRGLTLDSTLEVYRPLYQAPVESAFLTLRTPGDPLAWAPAAEKVLRQVDPGLAGGSPVVLADLVSPDLAASRFKSLLALLFAALALLLAAVGLYGIQSYSVTRRTHEMGIRIALGAQPWDVLRRVVLEGMAPVFAGLAAGLAAARLLSGLLADQLYEVSSGDPFTYTVTALVIVLAGLVAAYFPAHRATQVDPLAALREE